jgi:hypothetical protein
MLVHYQNETNWQKKETERNIKEIKKTGKNDKNGLKGQTKERERNRRKE